MRDHAPHRFLTLSDDSNEGGRAVAGSSPLQGFIIPSRVARSIAAPRDLPIGPATADWFWYVPGRNTISNASRSTKPVQATTDDLAGPA